MLNQSSDTATSASGWVFSKPLIPHSAHLGSIRIAVTDADKALAIWRDVVGLTLIKRTGNVLHLGVGDKVLVMLEVSANRRVTPNRTGLYHVAIHVPERADMARMVLRAVNANVRVSLTDHLVSEAIYLWDMDGNGIEITFETPWRGKLGSDHPEAFATLPGGHPHSGREPIEVNGLMAEIADDPTPSLLPVGTRIGHVHMHVADLEAAMIFYRDLIGFGGQMLMPSRGMGDVELGFMPHIVAFNVWAGQGAQRAPEGAAGLRWFSLVVPDENTRDEIAARLLAANAPSKLVDGVIETSDPSGNHLRIQVAD